MDLRGVVLAGGRGTRLGELTKATNKHLLPLGDSPVVCHAVRKLTGVGIRDILLVTGPEHLSAFACLLGSGQCLGCDLSFRVQAEPGGIAQALALARQFCNGAHSLVLLGDNVFEDSLGDLVSSATAKPEDAWVLLKRVPDPGRFGVAEVRQNSIHTLEEKPATPASDLAITGVYLYPPDVFDIAEELRPSGRAELEITDLNCRYLAGGRLSFRMLSGYWTDAGTVESLREADRLVRDYPPQF